jgi:glutamine kinase
MKISYSFGIVDLLHYGHINVLSIAKKNSDYHIFGLVSDDAVIEWAGTSVSNYDERKMVLNNIPLIDEIMMQNTFDPLTNLYKIRESYPDSEITLYHGDNWKTIPYEKSLEKLNIKIKLIKYYDKMSPENIIEKLTTKNITLKTRDRSIISTKGNTLQTLKEKLSESHIEDIYLFTVQEYNEHKELIYEHIREKFSDRQIIVRSSCSTEDGFVSSNAGHYTSVLNVDTSNPSEVHVAVESVIKSYGEKISTIENEQILIQTQTTDVKTSGVLFTRDIQQNRPYYLINYDDDGSTDSVTSGSGGKTIWISHDQTKSLPSNWQQLIIAVKEIEALLDGMILDIEFAITRTGKIVIFQVRPLAANYKYIQEIDDEEFMRIKNYHKEKYASITGFSSKEPLLLSDMAFWNPSELIGPNPNPLDYSLFREIITKRTWNDGLQVVGYKQVPGELMYKIGNKPYISLDHTFMTLIPADLPDDLSNKIMRYYKEKLEEDLTAHDKIEFEIAFSCLDFSTEEKLTELIDSHFTGTEIQVFIGELYSLTKNSISNFFKILESDLRDLELLSDKREKVESQIRTHETDIRRLIVLFSSLLSDIVNLGTPHFTRQARYAFIARSMCKSLVSKQYITEDSMDYFMLSIETIASDFKTDYNQYLNDQMPKDVFNRKYGHLRSGTYDIRTLRYDQMDFLIKTTDTQANSEIQHSSNQPLLSTKAISKALEEMNFDFEPDYFVNFLKSALEQRELFKFEFSKSLSLAIEVLVLIGKRLKIDRDLLSYLELPDIYSSIHYSTLDELTDFWMTLINQRKLIHEQNTKLVLPEVITNQSNIDFIEIGESRPNFITNKTTQGPTALLDEGYSTDLSGKIIVISKADPGFDWIFGYNIGGLITQYGGAASHMAIRCAEFGIPAAIGCGEKIYSYVSGLNYIEIDCKNGKILEVIQ